MKNLLKPIMFLLILVVMVLTSACGKTAVIETVLPVETETTNPTAIVTSTHVPATPTYTSVLPTATPTVQPPPPGTFRVLFYEPLVLSYDVDQWEDMTLYCDPQPLVNNYLQSKSLPSCVISVQGPTEFNDPTVYHPGRMHLGDILYETKLFSNDPGGMISTFFIDNESLPTFDYTNWLPVLVVRAEFDDWNDCRYLAEPVLATLSMP